MTISLSTLRTIKNNVIGNPSAKAKCAQDGTLPFILNLLKEHSVPQNLRIEAVHVITSIARGSPEAVRALLLADTHCTLLAVLGYLTITDPPALKSSITKAYKTIAVACADIVGPSLWGLSQESEDLKEVARSVLDQTFLPSSLEILLPLLGEFSSPIPALIASLLANCLRIPTHQRAVAGWQPPSERVSTNSRRGWETSISRTSSMRGGGWVARQLATSLETNDTKMQEASLLAIAALATDNESVAALLARGEDGQHETGMLYRASLFLTSRSVDLQLAGCLCVVRIARGWHPPSTSQVSTDTAGNSIILTALHVLNRIIGADYESYECKIRSCFTLSYLVADDRDLQRTACDSGILKRLIQIVQSTLKEPADEWDSEEPEVVSRLKEAALIAIASLAMLRDDVRRELNDSGIASLLQTAMSHPHVAVRYAACQCARALTRSVHVLRTSVIDTGIGSSLFNIVKTVEEDHRIRVIALAGMCNLLNNFSPFREILLNQGGIRELVGILDGGDDVMRNTALCAVKNALFNSKLQEKNMVMNEFGWARLTRYLTSPNVDTREQAISMIRNLAFPSPDLAFLRRNLGDLPLTEAVEEGLYCESSEVTIQALGALGHLAQGPFELRKDLLGRKRLLAGLKECLQHVKVEVRREAIRTVCFLVKAQPRRHGELREAGIDKTLRLMYGANVATGPQSSSLSNSQMGYEEDQQVRADVKKSLMVLDFIRND